MDHESLLIQGAAAVTMDPELGELSRADILIDGGVIAAIGEDLVAPDAEVIDGRGMVAIPGMVDGHRHMWEGLLRNSLPDGDIHDYLRVVNGQLAPAYTAQDAYLGELVTALGALDAGVTTVLDWSHIQTTPEHTAAVLEALDTAQIRAVFAFGPPGADDQDHAWPAGIARLAEQLDRSLLVTPGLATFSPEHQPYEVAVEHFKLARECDALITVHAGLSGIGEPGQIERLGRDGLLGPDVNLVHCNTLSAVEWSMVADTGTSVTLTPSTEMQMGQGMPALMQARRVGMTPSIGVDVEVGSATDLWTQMRILFSVQRLQALDGVGDDGPGVVPVTTAELLRCATIGGASACRLQGAVGSLTVGKQADVVLLRTGTIHAHPINDLTGAVVHSMDARNVDTVIVRGRAVKRAGALVGVDVDDLLGQVTEARQRVFAKARRT